MHRMAKLYHALPSTIRRLSIDDYSFNLHVAILGEAADSAELNKERG